MPINFSILNPAQKEAVEQIYGPCMIIAGAGSGKTRVLTYKIAHLIDSGISPYEILALTFTNKAANEMKSRVEELIGYDAFKVWMGTFHSIFAKLLRFEADKIGFTRSYSIYDSVDSVNFIKKIISEKGYSSDRVNPKGIHSSISTLKNKLILPEHFSSIAKTPFDKIIDDIYDEYQRQLLRNNAMDFDDLLIKPIELFNKHPQVLEKYQNRFRFILVDEYQDTNRAQYIMIRLLSDKFQNISIVGDDAQSIYKWRGAEIKNIFDFESDYPEKKTFCLEQNYRSTKKILSVADEIIKNNEKQIDKTLWTENEDGENITLFETLTDKEEAQRICRYVREEIHNRKLKFSDFGILYRTNAQSRILEEALIKEGIPYIVVGGIKFYQRKEIKDIIAYLRIIINPDDTESLNRILGLREGLGKVSIERIAKYALEKNKTLFEALIDYEQIPSLKQQAKNVIKELLILFHKYNSIRGDMKLDEYVRGFIDEMGILPKLRIENTAESEERIENIKELISAVADFANSDKTATLEDFLERVSLVSDIDEYDNKKNAVVLMTIHSSKGLEYPVIFITGLEDGLFPVTSAFGEDENMEEERRLFYVAATRAEKKLYISFANQRYKFGVLTFQMKSRFLKEISDETMSKNITYEKFIHNRLAKSNNKKIITTPKKGIHIQYDPIEKNAHTEEYSEFEKFSDIKKGTYINHDKFGSGKVISVMGKGLDKKADILFEDFGLKKIILKYAKLRIEN